MKTLLSLEDYQQALDGAGPRLKEVILDKAAHDDSIQLPELKELVALAYPEQYV